MNRENSAKNSISARPQSADRHHALDLIRGLAALSVAQFHFMTWNGVATVESMGTFAVYVFFVLSGLTMMMVYGDRFRDGVTPEEARSFFRKRFARLIPLLAAVAALSLLKEALLGTPDIVAAAMTGTGLMALHMPGFLSNSVGAWSLGIELGFYAVFPLIPMIARSVRSVAIVVLCLLVAQHLLIWKIQGVAAFWIYYISHLTFAPLFGFGILISFESGGRRRCWLILALLMLLAILAYSLVVRTDLMRDQLSYLALTLACALVIWAAWRSTLPSWLIPVATLLGDVSYSLYLTHWIANDVVRLAGLPLHLSWVFFTALALAGGALCYRWFEAPMRRRLGSRLMKATPNPA